MAASPEKLGCRSPDEGQKPVPATVLVSSRSGDSVRVEPPTQAVCENGGIIFLQSVSPTVPGAEQPVCAVLSSRATSHYTERSR